MTDNNIENQIVEVLKQPGNQDTEQESTKLERDIKKWNQTEETKRNLGKLRRNTFFEKKGNNIYYKIDAVNNYLKEISISNKKIKEFLIYDRKTIVTAIQIALYKAGYLPVGWIDGQRGPITRGSVTKFQNENGLKGQKNPGYLNINTINKLIEVSTKKELDRKQNKKPIQRISTRKQINISVPNNKIIEHPDKTRVNKNPTITSINNINLKNILLQRKAIESEKKGGTMEEVRLDITNKVGNFREWHNGDCRFVFKNTDNNENGDLPKQITVCGETYKYNGEGNDFNGLGFETYDGGRAFQLGTYVNGILEEGFRFYFDGVKEIGEFDYVGDLKNGTRMDANGSEHKVENGVDI